MREIVIDMFKKVLFSKYPNIFDVEIMDLRGNKDVHPYYLKITFIVKRPMENEEAISIVRDATSLCLMLGLPDNEISIGFRLR